MITKDKILQILNEKFTVLKIEVIDDSAQHAGHAESIKSGGGHFEIIITAKNFIGTTPLQRHRMINEALKEHFKDDIHALSIKALAPMEDKKNPNV